MTRHSELAFLNFIIQSVYIFVFEWQVATVHSVENDTTRPDIDFTWIIFELGYHLGSCVARRPTGCLQQVPLLEEVAQTKVSNFNLFVVQEYILGF